MSRPAPLLRWSSPARPDRQAAELRSAAFDDRPLDQALRRVAGDLAGARFLVVNVDVARPADVRKGIDAFHAAGGTARVCLAGSRETLMQFPVGTLDNDRVGLLLDGVDAHTPCADLAWDRIEAVRFSPDFVVEAARHLRLGCVLESMLGLARDMGLCTLGAHDAPGGASLSDRAAFDYLPIEALAAQPAYGSHRPKQRAPDPAPTAAHR